MDIDYLEAVTMTEAEVDAFLAERDYGVLAMADGDEAYAIPIAFVHDPDRDVVYFRFVTSPGSIKDRFAKTDGTVSLIVYEVDDDEDARSVRIWGKMEPVEESDQGDVASTFLERIAMPPYWWAAETTDQEVTLYRLDPEGKTGRTSVLHLPDDVADRFHRS